MTAPILVVGAGPVGLALAVDLARRRVPVRIIDTLEAPTTESRAIVLHARTLDQLEVLGVADQLAATGIRSTGVEFHAGRQRLAHIPLGSVDSRHPFSITTAQTETERVLTERLAALGVTIERGVTLTGLEQRADGVRASVQRAGGPPEVIETPWLVGADGAHGKVRGGTGQHLEGVFRGETFLMGDVEADFDYDRSSFHIFFSPGGGTALLFPMVGRRCRVFAQLPDGGDAGGEVSLERVSQAMAARDVSLKIRAAHWLTRLETHHAQVARYRVGRVFLAGDAAHVHSPAGGQGMNTGIQDALNLSWKLARAWRGQAGAALLDSYHDERHPIAAQVIAFTTKLTAAGTVASSLLRHLRDAAMKVALSLPPAQHVVANEVEELDVSYRGGSLVGGAAGDLRGGDFFRDRDGAVTAALGAGDVAERAAHVALLVPAADGAPPAPPLPADVKTLGVAARPEEPAFRDHGGIVIVRPDGYVGLVAPAKDTQAVSAYFGRLT